MEHDADVSIHKDSSHDTHHESDSAGASKASADTGIKNSDGDTGSGNGDNNTDTDSDTESGTDADTDSDTDVDTDADADADTDADTDTDTDSDGDDTYTIPQTCAEASASTTSVGCLFYAVSLDQFHLYDVPYSIAVSNVNMRKNANVTVFDGSSGTWTAIAEAEVAPMDLHLFELSAPLLDSSGLYPKSAFKIVSDLPVVAYQFSPIDRTGLSASSDASLLLPVSAYDEIYYAMGWEGGDHNQAYITMVAARDGTEVTIVPSTETVAGPGVPQTAAPFQVMMDDGDVLEVATARGTWTGTLITTNPGHAVAVFTGHECAFVPQNISACDHLEEQMPGLQFWGTDFLAPSLPVRLENESDSVVWRVLASEDNTTIEFSAADSTSGVPTTPVTLEAGDSITFMVTGTNAQPGDFGITSSHPIGVMQYMTGTDILPTTNTEIGDPAQIYLPPIEQFLNRYVVLVPDTWENDYLIVTKSMGDGVLLDGEPISDALFSPVADTSFAVARILVDDGVHRLEAKEPDSVLGVIVIGFDYADSYAYAGGMGTGIINPIIVI